MTTDTARGLGVGTVVKQNAHAVATALASGPHERRPTQLRRHVTCTVKQPGPCHGSGPRAISTSPASTGALTAVLASVSAPCSSRRVTIAVSPLDAATTSCGHPSCVGPCLSRQATAEPLHILTTRDFSSWPSLINRHTAHDDVDDAERHVWGEGRMPDVIHDGSRSQMGELDGTVQGRPLS